jgi:hypothetical protein
MIRKLTTLIFLSLAIGCTAKATRTVLSFDDRRKFYKGDAPGAETVSVDGLRESQWGSRPVVYVATPKRAVIALIVASANDGTITIKAEEESLKCASVAINVKPDDKH